MKELYKVNTGVKATFEQGQYALETLETLGHMIERRFSAEAIEHHVKQALEQYIQRFKEV